MRLYQLFEAMPRKGHHVFFIGSQRIPVETDRIQQYVLGVPYKKKENAVFWFLFIVSSFIQSFLIAKRERIDRIVTFGPFYSLLCCLSVWFLKVSAVTFVRADNMKHSRNPVRNLFFYVVDGIGIKISSRTIFTSNALKKIYQKRYRLSEKKIDVIPNNIKEKFRLKPEEKASLRQKMGISPEAFIVSTTGVFNRGKNFDFLIRSIGELKSQNVKLVIIGDEVVPNGERKRLRKLVWDEALNEKVIFVGWQDDVRPLIASSDLFVFPSRFEGSPNALLEALGCGVPCLGSHIDEIKEVLSYRELLFNLKTKDELIDRISSAMVDQAFYDRIQTLSQKRCEHFLFDWCKKVLQQSMR